MQVIAGFDWDEGNAQKCGKHGVRQEVIEHLFRSGPRIAPDPKHSEQETRFIAIGRDETGRPLFVAFTFRQKADGLWLRPISARYMHAKEADRYESQSSDAER